MRKEGGQAGGPLWGGRLVKTGQGPFAPRCVHADTPSLQSLPSVGRAACSPHPHATQQPHECLGRAGLVLWGGPCCDST